MFNLNNNRLVVACADNENAETCINIQDYFFNSKWLYLNDDLMPGATPFELLLAALNSGLSLFMMVTAKAMSYNVSNIIVSSNFRKNGTTLEPEVEMYVDIVGNITSDQINKLLSASEEFVLLKMIQKALPVHLKETMVSDFDGSEE